MTKLKVIELGKILNFSMIERIDVYKRQLHEQGEVSYLEVLLSAIDFKDFLTRYEMVNSIIEQDVDLKMCIRDRA